MERGSQKLSGLLVKAMQKAAGNPMEDLILPGLELEAGYVGF